MDSFRVALKQGYEVIIRNNSNFLSNVIEGRDECFLSPAATLAIQCFQSGLTVGDTVTYLSNIFNAPVREIKQKIESLIRKLSDYTTVFYPSEISTDKEKSDDYVLDVRHLRCNVYPYGAVKRSFVPEKIVFNVTDYCPRECIYCFNGAKCTKKHKIKDEFLPLDRFESVLLEAKRTGVKTIEIGGGDPFIRQDITDYLSICDQYYPGAWGTSTKAFISKAVAQKLSRLSSVDIQISLDAFDEVIADTLMGVSGSYRQILKSFDNLLNIGIVPSAKMVITSLNCDLIADSFHRFAEMGIKTIRANVYMMSPNRHSEYLYPSPAQIDRFNKEVEEILAFAYENCIETDIRKVEMPAPIQHENGIDSRVFCGASTSDMYIRHDGMMIFCGQINNCEELTIGNLKDSGIMELWHSKKISDLFRPGHLKNCFSGTKCFDCKDYNRCYPKRCYVRSYVETGSFFDVDPACPYGTDGYINRG